MADHRLGHHLSCAALGQERGPAAADSPVVRKQLPGRRPLAALPFLHTLMVMSQSQGGRAQSSATVKAMGAALRFTMDANNRLVIEPFLSKFLRSSFGKSIAPGGQHGIPARAGGKGTPACTDFPQTAATSGARGRGRRAAVRDPHARGQGRRDEVVLRLIWRLSSRHGSVSASDLYFK